MEKIKLIIASIIILGISSCVNDNSSDSLKWNFKNFKKLKYDYIQVSENQNPFGMDEKIFNEAKGTLIVSVKENGKADIIFKELKMSMFSVSEDGDTNRMISQTVPDFFMQDMDEFGKIDGQLNQQTELLAQTLFPITNKDISVKNTTDLPVTMPFNMFGSVIIVKGFNKVTLESVDENIASLTTLLDVSEFDIPEDANVDYECYMKGNSDYKFDLDKGYFTKANLNITMVAKSISSENEDETEDNNSKSPEDMLRQMSKGFGMEMKTNIKLELKEVE